MSIVEKALQKMQQGNGSRHGVSLVLGKVVESPREQAAATPAAKPARLISINQDALRAAGLLAPEHQNRQIASQYRQIKRPLVAQALGRGKPPLERGQLIMVTSAMPSEGKTFTSINLALSMALEKDLRVVLVDADAPKPQISKMFGISAETGMLDALADPQLDVEDLILGTDIPNLFVLPSGARNDHATELFASERMTQSMQRLVRRDPGRIVLFDTPPLLLTTESQALTHVVGQIVVVVRAQHTPQHVLLDALSYLPETTSTSLILNQSVTKSESGSYYYGYGAPEQEAHNEE